MTSHSRSVVAVAVIMLFLGSTFVLLVGVPSAQSARAEEVVSWTATDAYPLGVFSPSCVVSGGYLYCIGGTVNSSSLSNPYTASVYVAPTSPSGVGGWASTTSYPTVVSGASCAISGDYVYCVGGNTQNGTQSDAVYYAPISSSGVGAWTSTTSYPFAVTGQSCLVSGAFLYCIGGSYNAAVYYASVSPTGGIGAWTGTTNYENTTSQSCSASGEYIYCVGGQVRTGQTGIVDAVNYTHISSSGGLGTWMGTTSYPIPITDESCVISGSYVYCVGGRTRPNAVVSDVYFAAVSSSGIGSWTATTGYPIDVWLESCATSGGYIYCGGGNVPSSNAVYFAAIAPQSTASNSTVTTATNITTTPTTSLTPSTSSSRTTSLSQSLSTSISNRSSSGPASSSMSVVTTTASTSSSSSSSSSPASTISIASSSTTSTSSSTPSTTQASTTSASSSSSSPAAAASSLPPSSYLVLSTIVLGIISIAFVLVRHRTVVNGRSGRAHQRNLVP